MSFLFNTYSIYHTTKASAGAEQAASGAQNAASRAEQHVKLMEVNLGKALMICEALWELLSEKTGLTQDDLYKKLYEIDMRDGQLDGKNQRSVINCPACSRPVSGRHAACLYCGHEIDKSVFQMD